MTTGLVKFFNEKKGFGFIVPNGGGPDIFVHFSAILGTGRRNLMEGQTVEFEVGQGKKGKEAKNVRVVQRAYVG